MKRSAAVRPESPVEGGGSAMDERVIGGAQVSAAAGAENDFSLPMNSSRSLALTPIRRKGGGTGVDISSPPVTRVDVVAEKANDPYPLYHLKGRNLIVPVQVDCTRGSLNSGDVFVLDMRAHEKYCIVQWTGAEANRREKAAGRQYCEKLVAEVTAATKPIIIQLEDRKTPLAQFESHVDDFWNILGGRGSILAADEVSDDVEVTRTRRMSLRTEARRAKLARMSRSESFRYIAKERMEQMSQILHHTYWTIWITALTVYALFGDDLRFLLTDRRADPVFYTVSIIALLFFILELFLNWMANPGWCLGFYFWLDFAATISLLPDIGWIWDPFFAAISGEGSVNGGDTGSGGDALKVGRSSRAGAKAGRVVRIVRLVRMVRMVKLYKMHGDTEASAALERRASRKESKVGAILSEKTTRKVIILVLLLILVLPQLDGMDPPPNNYHTYGLANLHRWAHDFNCNGMNISENDVQKVPLADKPWFVNRDALFRPLVQNYARRVGRLMHLKIAGLEGTSLHNPKYPTDLNTTKHWVEETRFATEEQMILLEVLRTGTVDAEQFSADAVTIKYEAGRAPLTLWGEIDYEIELRTEAEIDEYYRPSEMLKEMSYGCSTQFIQGGCNNTKLIGRWEAEGFSSEACTSVAILSIKPEQQLDAGLNLVKTIFVMMVLVWGAVTFQQDAQRFVIGPIERMMDTVSLLSQNPLANLASGLNDADDLANKRYETALLEKTIEKVSKLMQVGFGAAGAEVIGTNMQGVDGSVNVMADGVVITSIYGFCDIRKFTDTTECLQEQVMTYVNSLGNMVHGATHRWFGMANKNVGDAFLLTWKICDGKLPGFHDFLETQHGKSFYDFDECQRLRAEHKWNQAMGALEELLEEKRELQKKLIATEGLHQNTKKSKKTLEEIAFLKEELEDIQKEIDAPPQAGYVKPARPGKGAGRVERYVSPIQMADAAFAAFVTACVDLKNANVDGCCVPFINHERVVKRFGKGFTIRMGFGMHVGWCVQGAIGSGYKIDCTYLSPHVEMSDRLEAGSKIYVTPMNLSHWFVALMSPTIKKHLRAIDRIKVSGVPVPMTVYTFDIFNYEACRRQPFLPSFRRLRQQNVDFITDSSCTELQRGMHPEFLTTFRRGYAYYVNGNWSEAKACFEKTLAMPSPNQYNNPETGDPLPDGPSTTLMKFMGQTNFEAPAGWDGVRQLDGY